MPNTPNKSKMRYLKYCFILLVLSSCGNSGISTKGQISQVDGSPINVYVIDSCEYIGYVRGGSYDWLTHKGNCTNPIHNN